MHPAFMSPSTSSSFPYQDFSQMQLPLNIRRELMMLDRDTPTVQWVDNDSLVGDELAKGKKLVCERLDESSDPESETFFDCDVNESDIGSETATQNSNLKPSVKMVSKTVLQEFDPSHSNEVKLRKKVEPIEPTTTDSKKRNSLSAVSNPSPIRPQSPRVKVKKSLSNSDLKVTRVPVLSSSSFKRVFSPFAPKSPSSSSSKSKRAVNKNSSSTASLNVEKEDAT